MTKKGILIDVARYTMRDCIYDDTRIDDIYVKVDGKHLTPAAYVFPEHNATLVAEELLKLQKAKKEFDDIQANIFYKVFPTLR